MKTLKNFTASSISPVFILGLGNRESSGSFSNVYLKPQLLQDTATSDVMPQLKIWTNHVGGQSDLVTRTIIFGKKKILLHSGTDVN